MLTPERAPRFDSDPSLVSYLRIRGRWALSSMLLGELLTGLAGCAGGSTACLDACEQQNQQCGATAVNCDGACSTVQVLSEEGCQGAFSPLLECLQQANECASLWNDVCGAESDGVRDCLSALCSKDGQSRACRVGLFGRATTGGSPGTSGPSTPTGGIPAGTPRGTCDPAHGCVAVCALGAQRCSNNAIETCASGASGPVWQLSFPCPYGCSLASGGCRACQLGSVQCLGNAVAECADEGLRVIQTCTRSCAVNDLGQVVCL
jgi:hypothetical protein